MLVFIRPFFVNRCVRFRPPFQAFQALLKLNRSSVAQARSLVLVFLVLLLLFFLFIHFFFLFFFCLSSASSPPPCLLSCGCVDGGNPGALLYFAPTLWSTDLLALWEIPSCTVLPAVCFAAEQQPRMSHRAVKISISAHTHTPSPPHWQLSCKPHDVWLDKGSSKDQPKFFKKMFFLLV